MTATGPKAFCASHGVMTYPGPYRRLFDPLRYGIEGDLWGLWFLRNTMLRDLLCLNKVEPLPWDCSRTGFP